MFLNRITWIILSAIRSTWQQQFWFSHGRCVCKFRTVHPWVTGYQHESNLIPAWINNSIYHEVWLKAKLLIHSPTSMAILNHLSILGLKLVHVSEGTPGLPTVSVSAHSVSLRWRHNEHDGVSHLQPYDCLLNRLFRRRSKKIQKLRVTGLCAGNSPVTGEFPAQKASNAENAFIRWRHHVRCLGHSSLVPLIPQLRARWTNPYPPHNQFSKVSG